MTIVGPQAALLAARSQLEPLLTQLGERCDQPQLQAAGADRHQLAESALSAWHGLQLSRDRTSTTQPEVSP